MKIIAAALRTVCSLAVIATTIEGQSHDLDPIRIGEWAALNNRPVTVRVRDNLAYVTLGTNGLAVLDVQNPQRPELLGRYNTEGNASGLAIAGRYAYVADGGTGLQIIDISDPLDLRSAGGWYSPGFTRAVVVSGEYAYIADDTNGLEIINIANPSNLRHVGGYDTMGSVVDVAVVGDYTYLADYYGGLQVLDTGNVSNPVRAGSYQTGGPAWSITVSNGYAYVAKRDFAFRGYGVEIIDVRDPSTPRPVARLQPIGIPCAISLFADHAFVAAGSGMEVLNIADPSRPEWVTRHLTDGFVNHVTVENNLAYLANTTGAVQIVKFAHLANPQKTANHGTRAVGVAVSGNNAFVIGGSAALEIIDVTDGNAPRSVGQYHSTNYFFSDIAVLHDYAFLTDYYADLFVVDINDRSNPSLVTNLQFNGDPYAIAISGDHAYIASSGAGLIVVDIKNPAMPKQVGYYTSIEAYSVAVSGKYVYLGHSGGGALSVFDVSNPASPSYLGFQNAGRPIRAVTVVGQHAYLACEAAGVVIMNVTNPELPRVVGRYNTPGIATALGMSGRYLYVADYYNGLEVIDVSDPAKPQRVGGNPTFVARDVALTDEHVLVAADTNGLMVLNVFTPLLRAPFALTQPLFESQGFRFSVEGLPGLALRIEFTEDLKLWHRWTNVTTSGTPMEFMDEAADRSRPRAYRAVAE